MTSTGVWVVLTGVSVLLAFADVLLRGDANPWWIAGIGLVAATAYVAVTVRPIDLWVTVIAPPLAFLVAILTAGQLTLGSSGSLLLREAVMVFEKLSFNAPFIIGATALALVIVLVRRHRLRAGRG